MKSGVFTRKDTVDACLGFPYTYMYKALRDENVLFRYENVEFGDITVQL
jgi:hypothetical protein